MVCRWRRAPFTPVPGGILLQTGLLGEAVDHVVEIQLR